MFIYSCNIYYHLFKSLLITLIYFNQVKVFAKGLT